jgi:uncharacterized protein (TIGR04551 family)
VRNGALAALLVLCSTTAARATGFTDIGQDIRPREKLGFEVHGYLRARSEALYNLDLDRGLLPSGQPLYPVPLGEPKSQWLFNADMRLRTDLALYAPGGGVAVKVRLDTLDNVALGSRPEGVPYASLTQRPTGVIFSLRRAYGEAVLPFGVLAIGRMGNHWGLGMFANGGDCLDCNAGDSVDRVAFMTPLAGHVFAFAYDFSATLAVQPRANNRYLSVAPFSGVRSVSFAALSFRDDHAKERRRKAGKSTFEYGAIFSHRWQDGDVPADYLPVPGTGPVTITDAQVMGRGAKYFLADAYATLVHPEFRVGAEVAVAAGQVDQPSLVPGVLLRDPIKSTQVGVAVESEIGTTDSPFGAGLDGGFATGDTGAILGATPLPPPGGHLDAFRFAPDYHVDRILFREILGQVTGAVYIRPHARARIFKFASGELRAEAALIASFASADQWTPSWRGDASKGDRALGVEIDPGLVYRSRDGFFVALDHAVLLPLSGLDNTTLGLKAQPAQLIRARVAFLF